MKILTALQEVRFHNSSGQTGHILMRMATMPRQREFMKKVSNSDTGADNKIRNLCEKLVRL